MRYISTQYTPRGGRRCISVFGSTPERFRTRPLSTKSTIPCPSRSFSLPLESAQHDRHPDRLRSQPSRPLSPYENITTCKMTYIQDDYVRPTRSLGRPPGLGRSDVSDICRSSPQLQLLAAAARCLCRRHGRRGAAPLFVLSLQGRRSHPALSCSVTAGWSTPDSQYPPDPPPAALPRRRRAAAAAGRHMSTQLRPPSSMEERGARGGRYVCGVMIFLRCRCRCEPVRWGRSVL